MTEAQNEESHRQRAHLTAPGSTYVELDLAGELESLHREAAWNTGHNAKTLVKYDDFRIVLMALKAHGRMPTHQASGRISIHTIRGRIQVHADGRTFILPVGGLLTLDRDVRHDVEALEDSAFVLTIAWPRKD